MAVMTGKQQFVTKVFPAELAQIRRRRANAGDSRALPDGRDDAPPSTTNDLLGLAFSGGGIRSASFCMGVVQQLIAKGLFNRVDYLSTVSGGGYTGSCISNLMQDQSHGHGDGEKSLVERDGENEPPALNRVRNRSNYLMPRGLRNRLRLPALFIAGFLHTSLMLVPLIIVLVFATELFFELTSHILPDGRHWLAFIGLTPLALAVLIRPVWAGHGSWQERDHADRRLGGYLLLAGVSLLAVPALKWLGDIVNHGPQWIVHQLDNFATSQMALGLQSWLLWAALFTALLLAFGYIRFKTRLMLLLVAILGPLMMVTLYAVACIYVINSAISEDADFCLYADAGPGERSSQTAVSEDAGLCLHAAVAKLGEPGSQTTGNADDGAISEQQRSVQRLVDQLLTAKQINPAHYQIQWQNAGANDELVLQHRDEQIPWWMALLTTQGRAQLHIRFESNWWSLLRKTNDKPDLIFIPELALLRGNAEWWVYIGALLLWLYNHFFVNINRVSMHPFYRDRLSRTFLSADENHRASAADELKLSELGAPSSRAPYHLINTALNLQGSKDPQLRERKTVPFVLAQSYCGSDYTGYCPSRHIEELDPHFNLGTAMAISAAAAAPNMGTVTVPFLSFVMTLLNIRLNYWLPHPARTDHRSWWYRWVHARLGLRYLLAEAFANVDDRLAYINCSDGGHIENLAVYELLKRRCKTIVCVDGEADADFSFFGLITLQRYAEIDLGARIEIDLSRIRPDAAGRSDRHHALGTIRYSDGEVGTFIYMKLSCTGDEPEYVRFYKAQTPAFPHESTGDQFFEETQFEVYRALGFHVAEDVVADPLIIDKLNAVVAPDKEAKREANAGR